MKEEIEWGFEALAREIERDLAPYRFYTYCFLGKAAKPRSGLYSIPDHLLSDSQLMTVSVGSDHRLTIFGIPVGQHLPTDTKTLALVSNNMDSDIFRVALEPNTALTDIALILSSLSRVIGDFIIDDIFEHRSEIIHGVVHHYYSFGGYDDGESSFFQEYYEPQFKALKDLLQKGYNLSEDFPHTTDEISGFEVVDSDMA